MDLQPRFAGRLRRFQPISLRARSDLDPKTTPIFSTWPASLSETQNLVLLSRDLDYIPAQIARTYLTEASELLRMLYALRKTVRNEAEAKSGSRRSPVPGCRL